MLFCLAAAKGMTSMEAAAGFLRTRTDISKQVKGEQKPLLWFLFSHFMKPSSEPLGDQWEALGPTTRQG